VLVKLIHAAEVNTEVKATIADFRSVLVIQILIIEISPIQSLTTP
jgi:hypothetical protein